jgi:hypothetical protein
MKNGSSSTRSIRKEKVARVSMSAAYFRISPIFCQHGKYVIRKNNCPLNMLRHLLTAKEPRVSWAVLEIVNGRVHWIWKLKNRPAQVMTSNKVISDNEWHSILIDVKGNVRNDTQI